MFGKQYYWMSLTLISVLVNNAGAADVSGQVGKVFESVVIDPTGCDYCKHCAPLKGDEVDQSIELLELRRIANPEPHQSLTFTDLELWNGKLVCAFRVARSHGAPGDFGFIRVIASDEGAEWETTAELKIEGHDLRDPKLSITPDNRLMLSTFARDYPNRPGKDQSLSFFSADGRIWDGPYKVGDVNMWLWRTTWHNGTAYNIGQCTQGSKAEQFTRLYKSEDGKSFDTLIDRLFDKNCPNEHAMVYLPDDTAMCLLRRDMRTVVGADYAMLGTANPPYTDWQWKTLNVKVGGPEMMRLPDGRLLACVRRYVNDLQYYPCWTELGWIDPETATYTSCLKLPSYDDTSYAGMVWHQGLLWVSYYSCHERGEGKPNIYLAKIRIRPKLKTERIDRISAAPTTTSMPSDYGRFLAQHDVIYDSPGTPHNQQPGANLIDGPLMGNGDLGVVVHGGPEAMVVNVGKNDVWDRLDLAFPRAPMTQAELFDVVESGQLEKLRELWSGHSYGRHCNPCPKPCGQILLINDALEEASLHQRLSLYDAVLHSEFKNDSAHANVSTLVNYPENLILTRYGFEGDKSLSLKVELHRWDDDAKLAWRLDDDPQGVQYHSDPMPTKPTFGHDGQYFWVRYKFRADKMFPNGFEYVMLGTIQGAHFETSLADHRAVATIKGRPKENVEIYVSVVTSRDAEHPLVEAKRIVDSAKQLGYERLVTAHKQCWNSYWRKSHIDLSDDQLEWYWYINRYLVNCANKRGKVAPGLYGPWITNDWSRWHGDYHYNYNFMQTYWGIYTCNTPELGWPYYDYTHRILPMCRKEAQEIYNMRGAKYPLTAYPNAMETNPYPCLPLDRSMCLSAWAAQNLYWHYRYTLDDEFLRERAYPVMADCARFYQDFMKEENGKYVIWPTVSPEHHGITPKFRLNRNCTLDLALIKALLKETIAASELLNRDEQDRQVWRKMLSHIADYPTTEINDGRIIVDVENAGHISYNVPVPVAPVFPGGDIGLHSDQDLYTLAKNTLEHVNSYSGDGFIMIPMAWMRLGMKEKVAVFKDWCRDRTRWRNGASGYASNNSSITNVGPVMENVAMTAVISEMLLQSYDGKIRLFPAVPDEMSARFASLRTVGAFLIASDIDQGHVKFVRIKSLKGQACTVYDPWPGQRIVGQDLTSGKTLDLRESEGEIRFVTIAGHEYLLESAPRDE